MADPEYTRKIMLDAVEVAKRKQIFKVINDAYDLVVSFYRKNNLNRDDFKKHFGGLVVDFKTAKLRYEVAQNELNAEQNNPEA